MKKAITIFIGFLHDFAAGCWAASVLAIYWLDKLSTQRAELKAVFGGLERQFFWAGIVCVIVVLIGGMGRTFTYAYIGEVYGADAEKMRRKMLVIKHIVLITIFGLGIWWQYMMAFQ